MVCYQHHICLPILPYHMESIPAGRVRPSAAVWMGYYHINGLAQEKRNSIANALELRLSYTNPSILRPEQYGQYFADDVFKYILWTENICILAQIPLNFFTPKDPIDYEGILPKGPYRPCVSMAGRALLAGYPR